MTDFVLWTRGLRGAELSVMRESDKLNEYERKHKIGELVELRPAHKALSIDELRALYPAPFMGERE